MRVRATLRSPISTTRTAGPSVALSEPRRPGRRSSCQACRYIRCIRRVSETPENTRRTTLRNPVLLSGGRMKIVCTTWAASPVRRNLPTTASATTLLLPVGVTAETRIRSGNERCERLGGKRHRSVDTLESHERAQATGEKRLLQRLLDSARPLDPQSAPPAYGGSPAKVTGSSPWIRWRVAARIGRPAALGRTGGIRCRHATESGPEALLASSNPDDVPDEEPSRPADGLRAARMSGALHSSGRATTLRHIGDHPVGGSGQPMPASRRGRRRRWRRSTPSPIQRIAPSTATRRVDIHSGHVKLQNRNCSVTYSVFCAMKMTSRPPPTSAAITPPLRRPPSVPSVPFALLPSRRFATMVTVPSALPRAP